MRQRAMPRVVLVVPAVVVTALRLVVVDAVVEVLDGVADECEPLWHAERLTPATTTAAQHANLSVIDVA